jgi:hypothetical protein
MSCGRGLVTEMRQVIVESGHMVDRPDRQVPRFPPEAEGRIAAAIDDVLDRWDVGPDTVVLTQGARGTDILVAEAALRKGAAVQVFLALPAPRLSRPGHRESIPGTRAQDIPEAREFDAGDVDTTARDVPLFSYIRYNADISAKGLSAAGLGGIDPKRVARLDALSALDDLVAIGQKAAGHVKLEHFDGFGS